MTYGKRGGIKHFQKCTEIFQHQLDMQNVFQTLWYVLIYGPVVCEFCCLFVLK